MLRIYYGRENIDKEKAMFEKISLDLSCPRRDSSSKIFVLVPDQYTLQMERNAISHLNVKGLMEIEILSFSRLAARTLNETGGSGRIPIDKYGRHMLLSKIISDEWENMSAFRSMNKSHAFIELTNNLISDMKQHNTSPEEINDILKEMSEDSLLKRKLQDISIIFNKYEEEIKDTYIDSEDHLNFFISKIGQSSIIKNAEFWIFGFDAFTPKTIKIIRELTIYSMGVNIVLTSDDRSIDEELFSLTRTMIRRLEESVGSEMIEKFCLERPSAPHAEAIQHLEQNLFAYPYQTFTGEDGAIYFCRAANFYSEAETAASFILELVRDKGLRFRDIAVICNDMDGRGAIIKRVFDEYGISYFIDQKNHALHNPAIVFITSLLNLIQTPGSFENVFKLIKTGLTPISIEEAEDLENYAIRYRINGNKWRSKFKYGEKEYSEDEFSKLNENREILNSFIGEYEEKNRKALNAKEKALALLDFLKTVVGLESHLEALCSRLEDLSEFVAAMEVQQIWESVLNLLDQITELLGDRVISDEDFALMLKTGFESIELGLIPTTTDQVVIGTMQRTRVGRVKALIVIGANDGVIPAGTQDDGLLNRDEVAYLLNKDILICKDDDYRVMEERLAIYKQLSGPESYLWIGFSASDAEGKEIKPSIIFDKIRKIFPDIELEKDLRNREDPLALLDSPESSIKHLAECLREAEGGEDVIDPVWKAAYLWYKEKNHNGLTMVNQGLDFTNRLEKLEASLVTELFAKSDISEVKISPSRLERFSRCPFAHFVHYGLNPKENRVFEVAGREIGDVYHSCLMMLAQDLTVVGKPLADKDSPWMTVTKEECNLKIAEFMKKIAEEYKEGMLILGGEEKYRAERMQKVCERAAWALIEHVRRGQIDEMYFEEGFGQGTDKLFPPIRIQAGDREFLVEGKIDRVDVLPGDYVKVIDYKSGKEKFNLREALGGWRLQLMLYLKAVTEGMKELNKEVKPAGIFYFEIADSMINAGEYEKDMLAEKLEEEMRKQYRLDGVVLSETSIIENMAGEFQGFSEILPVRKNKDGTISGTSEGKLLTEEEFKDFQESMDAVITQLCSSLAEGIISINPKKNKDETACKYCDYKGICNFELSFDGCAYDVVK